MKMGNGRSLPDALVSSTSTKLSLTRNLRVELNGLFSLSGLLSEDKQRMTCEAPPSVEHGTTTPSSEVYHSGDKVAYVCERGYHLRGPGEITCNRGRWTLPPECVGVCAAGHIQS